MKPRSSREAQERFHAPLRHYHRVNSEDPSSWDEWIDGQPRLAKWDAKRIQKWIRIVAAVIGLGLLIALIIALYIELG